MVISGGNGCGKSAILEALIVAKEQAGGYGEFQLDPHAVSADAEKGTVRIGVQFSDAERAYLRDKITTPCPETDEIVIEVPQSGRGRAIRSSPFAGHLFSSFSPQGSVGFFDYITAYRNPPKQSLNGWNPGACSEVELKRTLAGPGEKYRLTKQYLLGLKMQDLARVQKAMKQGRVDKADSLDQIRDTFGRFFAPMRFDDVYVDALPFRFVVQTPRGEIDLDDLSSGEKEILHIVVRFHQLKPCGCVILLDEADAHLHPDLGRRYLHELRELARGNQLIVTTHSPQMMMEAGSEALYGVMKQPSPRGESQLVRVTEKDELHNALSELMGSRGLISINERIIFIEGEEASADLAIYEAFYPPARYNVSFVPAGDSATVRKTAERVNDLLTARVGFQQFFCIVDGDIERSVVDPTAGKRLFGLPVYHVENLLLDEVRILDATRDMLRAKCPYSCSEDVAADLRQLVLSDMHMKAYAKALFDAKLAHLANEMREAFYRRSTDAPKTLEPPRFEAVESESRAKMKAAIERGTWKRDCKGRDLLKAYCGKHQFRYEIFRNVLISKQEGPPPALQEVMDKILSS